MKISIDALGANKLKNKGIGTYTYEFLNTLLQMYPQPRYHLIWEDKNIDYNFRLNKELNFVNLNINRKANDYSTIERYLENNKIDIYHSPNNGFSIPKNKVCNYVATVHDLLPLTNAQYVDSKYLSKFKSVFNNTIENSDKIIAVSEVIKDQLRMYYDIPEKKIQVIYPGCSDIFIPENNDVSTYILKSKYNIKNDYILYVGSIHIRKNIDKLIRAFKTINEEINNIKLIIVGNNKGKREEYFINLMSLVESLSLKNSVIFLGEVEYEDIPYFYSNAKCVVNLSKYEGFPLTSLEAMTCNAPVICNNQAVFKEIFGQSNNLIDANDKEQLIESIMKVICDDKYRDRLIEDQRKVVDKYKWSESVIKIIRLYEGLSK